MTAYEMLISVGSSDVCSADLLVNAFQAVAHLPFEQLGGAVEQVDLDQPVGEAGNDAIAFRSGRRQLHEFLVERQRAQRRHLRIAGTLELGRASCRERVGQYV